MSKHNLLLSQKPNTAAEDEEIAHMRIMWAAHMARVSRMCASCRRCCPASSTDTEEYIAMRLTSRDEGEVEYDSPCRVIEARQYEAEAIEARRLQEEINQLAKDGGKKSGKKSKKDKKFKMKETAVNQDSLDMYYDETAVNEKYPHLKLDLRKTNQRSSKPPFSASFESSPIYSRFETLSDDGSTFKTPYMARKNIKTIQTQYGQENYSYVDFARDRNEYENMDTYFDNPELDVSPLEDEIIEVKRKRVPSIKLIPASKRNTFDDTSLLSPVSNAKSKTPSTKASSAKSSVHSTRKSAKRSPIDLFQGDDIIDAIKQFEPILFPIDVHFDTTLNKGMYSRSAKEKYENVSKYEMASSIDSTSSTTVTNTILSPKTGQKFHPTDQTRRQSTQGILEDVRSGGDSVERRQSKDRVDRIIQSSQRRATLIIEESDEEAEAKTDTEVFDDFLREAITAPIVHVVQLSRCV